MKLDFEKMGGLIPAIVQDYNTNKVLMLGFMNEEAYEETKATGKVTFFSRTKNRIWMKGETSGNTLQVVTIAADCDNDTLLIKAIPAGPVCHTGADTCFGEKNVEDIMFIKYLQNFIEQLPPGSRKVPTPLPCSRKASTAWHRRWAKKLSKQLSKPPTEQTTASFTKLPT